MSAAGPVHEKSIEAALRSMRRRFRVLTAGVVALTLVLSVAPVAATHLIVRTGDIQDGAVTTRKLRDRAVRRDKLTNGAVGTVTIHDGAVRTPDMRNGAVGTAKLKNGAVGTAKIQDGAVRTPDMRNGAVGTAKLKNGAVGPDQLDPAVRVRASEWQLASSADDVSFDGTTYTHAVIEAPAITQHLIDTADVVVYMRFFNRGFELPYVSNAGGHANTLDFYLTPGEIHITRFADDSSSIAIAPFLQYRYVITPPATMIPTPAGAADPTLAPQAADVTSSTE